MQTLLRTLSLCFRFIYNCKHPTLKITGSLTLAEINTTLHRIIKIVQVIDYPDEFKLLRIGNTLKGSSLIKLMPFIDNEGLLRVGGRLQNSSFAFDMKHPITLSKRNPLSSLLILDSHEKTLHGGITLTMSYVGRKFWIISGNQLAKTIIHKCMKCFRFSAKTSQQIMGNLPAVRLNASRPFKHSGVDYAGPIMLKNSSLRSTIISKGYICVFVCMVTKALHLEAVSDLTTNAFMAAFRRFVSRRGTCTDIYSDCGTNFVGASKELKILFNRSSKSLPDDLRHALSLNCTNWHFIPPASPNFGGLWEAGVKSVKHHLKRIVNDRLLNFEELSTLLCQIESCLNSRPLCPLSADPTDFEALTPAHFLIGEPTNSVPEESLLDTSSNRLSRWKNIEKMKQHFWKRWHSEYINRLQARPKWLKEKKNAKIGELVLISDERCAPGQCTTLYRILITSYYRSESLCLIQTIIYHNGNIKSSTLLSSMQFGGLGWSLSMNALWISGYAKARPNGPQLSRILRASTDVVVKSWASGEVNTIPMELWRCEPEGAGKSDIGQRVER
ncbi:uncharacterized protein LOC142235767 [Haematobia irritans]|uniref:uncharacterized protein LOC142235767 n=1 Tax=Haematobia irritans TaxID=7368 RepID=UPI003F502AB8